MRRLLLALVVLACGVGVYVATQTGAMPWADPGPDELQVAALREEFGVIRQQWKQAGRAATFGMDTSTITEGPLVKLENLERTLADLAPRLKTSEARSQARLLRKEIEAFKVGMR